MEGSLGEKSDEINVMSQLELVPRGSLTHCRSHCHRIGTRWAVEGYVKRSQGRSPREVIQEF
jgi:hypothetical protein